MGLAEGLAGNGGGIPASVVTVASPTTNEGLLWNGSAWVSAGTQSPGDNSVKPATTAYTDAAVAVEASRAATAEALKAPIASPTFTGTTTAPEFSASGLTGATAASRYVGATASGAPASGTFAKGDFTVDQTGIIWVCTTAGSPGTWTAIQPNTELGYTQITSGFTTSSATLVDVTALTTTVTVGARPVTVIATAEIVQNNTTGDGWLAAIMEDGTQVGAAEGGFFTGANGGIPLIIRARRAPAAGSHTYKVQLQAVLGGSVTISASATAPAAIQVIQI